MEGCCKRNCSSIPRIVRGNDWTARVRVLRAVIRDGLSVREDIDLANSTDIAVRTVSRFGKKTDMPFTIADGRLLVDFDENVPCGLYGLEVTGKDADGKDWRSFLKPGEFVGIVEATSDATGIGVSGILDVVVDVAPSTLSADMLTRLNSAIDNANSAAEKARTASDVKFVSSYANIADAPAPAKEGEYAMSGKQLYIATDVGGELQWREKSAERGIIYVDAQTAQSYVATDGGALIRLDREASDLLFDVEAE